MDAVYGIIYIDRVLVMVGKELKDAVVSRFTEQLVFEPPIMLDIHLLVLYDDRFSGVLWWLCVLGRRFSWIWVNDGGSALDVEASMPYSLIA